MSTITQAARAALLAAATAAASIATAAPAIARVLVLDGDSIPAGQGAAPADGLAPQLAADLRWGGEVRDVAISGQPVKSCLDHFDERIAPLRGDARQPGVIFFHAGDNDVAAGDSGAVAYAHFADYVRKAHAGGWVVVASTELPRFGFDPGRQRELADFNARVRRNAAGADAVADFAADPIMGGQRFRQDPRYYSPDGVHPSAGGYAVLARLSANAVRVALRRGPRGR